MPRQKLPAKNFQWTPYLGYVVGLITTDGSIFNFSTFCDAWRITRKFQNRVPLSGMRVRLSPRPLPTKGGFLLGLLTFYFYFVRI